MDCVCVSCFLECESALSGTETSPCQSRSSNSITLFHPATTESVPITEECRAGFFTHNGYSSLASSFCVIFAHQNENQGWMPLLFPPQNQTYPIHSFYRGTVMYVQPFPSLPVSKELTQHQKEGEAFWTPVYTSSFRENKLR